MGRPYLAKVLKSSLMAGSVPSSADDIVVGIEFGKSQHAVVVLDACRASQRLTRFQRRYSRKGFAEVLQRTAPRRVRVVDEQERAVRLRGGLGSADRPLRRAGDHTAKVRDGVFGELSRTPPSSPIGSSAGMLRTRRVSRRPGAFPAYRPRRRRRNRGGQPDGDEAERWCQVAEAADGDEQRLDGRADDRSEHGQHETESGPVAAQPGRHEERAENEDAGRRATHAAGRSGHRRA